MELNFVTYEIALKLKKLGFDEECLRYWNDYGGTATQNRFQLHFHIDTWAVNYIEAPLWQQAIDWFAEKYDIHIVDTINPWAEDKVYGYAIYANDAIFGLKCVVSLQLDTDKRSARIQAIEKAITLCQEQK